MKGTTTNSPSEVNSSGEKMLTATKRLAEFVSGERGPYTQLPNDIGKVLATIKRLEIPVADREVERAIIFLAEHQSPRGFDISVSQAWLSKLESLLRRQAREIERRTGLLREARATLEMWKDVAPAVSLCSDKALKIAHEALDELIATVRGECPSLLNEDSGAFAPLLEKIYAYEQLKGK